MMSISSSTDKDFTKVFPYLTLTTAPGKPTYTAIKQTQRNIFACASSIASLRGGGQHGEIGLVMTPSAYDLVSPATTYIRPVHPGDPPTYDGMIQREIHANEGKYIRMCLQLQKHQPTRAAIDQPPALRLQPKMACSHHGPRHR